MVSPNTKRHAKPRFRMPLFFEKCSLVVQQNSPSSAPANTSFRRSFAAPNSLQRILLVKRIVDLVEFHVAELDSAQVLVRVKSASLHLDDRHGDVAAVVGDTLVVVEDVGEDEAHLDRAAAALQARDVVCLDRAGELVDDLLERFHAEGVLEVVLGVALGGHREDLVDGVREHAKFLGRLSGEAQTLLADLLGSLVEVDRVVAQALEVADGVEHFRDDAAVVIGDGHGGKVHEVAAELVLVHIEFIFHAKDLGHAGFRVIVEKAHRVVEVLAGELRHLLRQVVTLGNCHGRGTKDTDVEEGEVLLHLGLFPGLLDDPLGQAGKAFGKWQKHEGGQNVECGVNDRNADAADRVRQECRRVDRLKQAEYSQPDGSSEDLDHHVDGGNALCLVVRADAGDQGRCAGTDVQAHDDRDGHREGKDAALGDGDQNTDGGRRRLDHGCDQQAHQHTEDRIVEFGHQFAELGHVAQRAHRLGHHAHTVHQDGKADEHGSDALILVLLGKHQKTDADERQERREKFRFQKRQPPGARRD